MSMGLLREPGRGSVAPVAASPVRSASPYDGTDPTLRLVDMVRARSQGLPPATPGGSLPPGVFRAHWDTFAGRFGGTAQRDVLMGRLQAAMPELARAGIRDVIIGGSFVTSKAAPSDVDVAWVPRAEHGLHPRFNAGLARHVKTQQPGINVHRADSILGNAAELGRPDGINFAEFFSTARDGAVRGVVLLPTQLPGAPETLADGAFMHALRAMPRMVG